jgi:hypothetical protein
MTATVPAQVAATAHTTDTAHPPKIETFDLDAMTNVDPKGFVRPVREFRSEPFGLFVARDFIEHPTINAMESWLLPDLGLRVTDWFFHPGQEPDQDFYLDVVSIEVNGRCWRTEDHYLDLVLRSGRSVEVIDTDELLDAVLAGLLDRDSAQNALVTAYRTVEGLARHGYRLDRWLAAMGASPTWTRHPRAQSDENVNDRGTNPPRR